MAARDVGGSAALWQSLTGTQHASDLFRNYQTALTRGLSGVFDPGDFLVTFSGGTFNVAAGRAMIARSTIAQGSYFAWSNSVVSDTVDAVGARTDTVQLKIYDQTYDGGGTNKWAVRYTPSNSNPGGSNVFDLANLVVNASNQITSVVDLRKRVPIGNVVICTSTSRPPSPYAGMEIYETDTAKSLTYNGLLSAWGRDWITFTPSWTNITIGNGINSGRMYVDGKMCYYQATLEFGSTTTITSAIGLNAPAGFTGNGAFECVVGYAICNKNSSLVRYAGVGFGTPGAQWVNRIAGAGTTTGTSGDRTGSTWDSAFPTPAWNTGDRLEVSGFLVLA